MTPEEYAQKLLEWRADIEAVHRKYDAFVEPQWGKDTLDAETSMAMYRAWCSAMTAWWEMTDVIKSLRAARYRLPRSTDSGATDAGTER